MSTFSPLRYPGGKAKLAKYLSEIIQLNQLSNQHYIEPFAGGAGVGLELLLCEQIKEIHINDLDRCVYAFWYSVLNHKKELCQLIRSTEINVANWIKQKEIRASSEKHDLLELGFATFFLNRTNRSGVLNAGPIGGMSQNGDWKLDCRFNKSELIERIERISFFASRISLSNRDAIEFIKECRSNAKAKSIVYLDPPYFNKGAYLYKNHFNSSDHSKLAEFTKSINQFHWVVSYDNTEEIKLLYADQIQEEFDIVYSANGYSCGKEIMIFDKRLKRPKQIYSSLKQQRHFENS